MARIRTIKPAFFRSEEVAALSFRARLTWIGLWTYVDDEGRGRDDARLIKGELWPLEDEVTWQEVERDLTELSRSGHVVRYEVSNRRFLSIPTWTDHQVISRPTKSKLPAVEDGLIRENVALTEGSVSAPVIDTAGSGTGNREVEQGNMSIEDGRQSIEPKQMYSEPFLAWWAVYPRKESKGDAWKAWESLRKARHLPELTELTAATKAYSLRVTDPQYRKLPGGWLRDRKWEDDTSATQQTTQTDWMNR